MGKQSNMKKFTYIDLCNRKLMLNMLRAEDKLYMSERGQKHITYHGGGYIHWKEIK